MKLPRLLILMSKGLNHVLSYQRLLPVAFGILLLRGLM